MQEIKALLPILKEQLKGHFLKMFFWMFITALGVTITTQLIGAVVGTTSGAFQIFTFVMSLFSICATNTAMFLFIKRVRNESFTFADITFSSSRVLFHIIMGLLLYIIQMCFNMVCAFAGGIPIIFYVLVIFVTELFLYWGMVVAYGIYDGNRKIRDLFSGSFALIIKNIKPLALAGIPYFLWALLSQYVITSVFIDVFGKTANVNDIVGSIAAVMNTANLFKIVAIYVVYYLVQYALLVPMNMIMANIYNQHHVTYMPFGTRFAEQKQKKIREK